LFSFNWNGKTTAAHQNAQCAKNNMAAIIFFSGIVRKQGAPHAEKKYAQNVKQRLHSIRTQKTRRPMRSNMNVFNPPKI
jgi:hypothetical protein